MTCLEGLTWRSNVQQRARHSAERSGPMLSGPDQCRDAGPVPGTAWALEGGLVPTPKGDWLP